MAISMPNKPTIKGLQAALESANARIAELQENVQNRDGEISALKLSQVEHDNTVRDLRSKLTLAEEVLGRIHKKTEQWVWVEDGMVLSDPLTFGDIRTAREAYPAISTR
jgi:hypothetical protein